MKYYLIAGEASGDLHASNLMRGIAQADPQADFRYIGGDLMAAQGGTLVAHYRDMAIMGFWEVLKSIRTIAKRARLCLADIADFAPDVLILVDYSGFNLRIAKQAHRAGIRTFYYIAPKVWAWNTRRVRKIRRDVDQLFIIFPFEREFFEQHGIAPIYEGNPTIDAIAQSGQQGSRTEFLQRNNLSDKPIIALLAGSRGQELQHNLPVMLCMEQRFPSHQLVIAGAPSLAPEAYSRYMHGSRAKLIFGQTYELLKHSELAFVTSGTATLETALLRTPQVVCYRGSLATMLIGAVVIKVKYISLVNLCTGRETVKELIQYKLTPDTLYAEAQKLLPGQPERERQLAEYQQLAQMLGAPGASQRVGARMVKELRSQCSNDEA